MTMRILLAGMLDPSESPPAGPKAKYSSAVINSGAANIMISENGLLKLWRISFQAIRNT